MSKIGEFKPQTLNLGIPIFNREITGNRKGILKKLGQIGLEKSAG